MKTNKIINIITVIVIFISVFMAGVSLANGSWLNCILEVIMATSLSLVYHHAQRISLNLELIRLRRELVELVNKINNLDIYIATDEKETKDDNDNNEHSNQ